MFIRLVVFICWLLPLPSQAGIRHLEVVFYDTPIALSFDDGMLLESPLTVEEMSLRRSMTVLEGKPTLLFLETIQRARTDLNLSDWLFAQLLQELLAHAYQQPIHAPVVQLNTFFFLAKSHYDVRLTYLQQQLAVYAYNEEKLYEVATIQSDGRQYALVTAPHENRTSSKSLYLLGYRPEPNGKVFQFTFTTWPHLQQDIQQRDISFQFNGQSFEIPVAYDANVAKLMNSYPLVDEFWYINAPISPSLRSSLLHHFGQLIRGRSQEEALQLIVAFTRSGFQYKEDKACFGRNKPMVPEELFHHPFSDCEDRSALFFMMVKELLNLPIAAVAYPDHITVAVAVEGVRGDHFKYKGGQFVFCDPTGPKNSSEIGHIPQGYEKSSFEILGSYFPE
ncbi:MAG: hypothetical protein R2795_26575 [Saprospiraceae bacterium]